MLCRYGININIIEGVNMRTISSSIAILLVSLLNNEPIDVNKYMNENIQPTVKSSHSPTDVEDIKLSELRNTVSKLTKKSEQLMHIIAALDIEDFEDKDISKSLKKLYNETEEIIKVSEYRFKSTKGSFKNEHEKVLYHTTVLNTYVFALIDEDLKEITGFKRTVPEDIFTTGKNLYAMHVKAERIFA